MQDVIERDEEEALMKQYTKPKDPRGKQGNQQQSGQGFVVRGGPWSPATEDFPSLGAGGGGGAGSVAAPPPKKMQWGPSMLGPKLPGTK